MIIPGVNIYLAYQLFDFVHELEVVSGWDKLTDTATIKLPANLKVDKNKLRSVIGSGQPAIIEAGYDGELAELFSGYVVSLSPSTPIEVGCEDEMWQLKQSSITDTLRNATLNDLLKKHFPGYQTNILNTELGKQYQIPGWSQAKILENIKEHFGLPAFFRKGVLTIGKPYDSATAAHHKFRFQYNIIDEDLEYKRKEDIRLEVTAISNKPNGKKIEVQVGDKGGEKRTLNFYDLGEDALEAAAKRELERLKYDGYRGDITVFGEPVVYHGDIIELEHPEESDKAGAYWVDEVTYTAGVNGFRQVIKLGPLARPLI